MIALTKTYLPAMPAPLIELHSVPTTCDAIMVARERHGMSARITAQFVCRTDTPPRIDMAGSMLISAVFAAVLAGLMCAAGWMA